MPIDWNEYMLELFEAAKDLKKHMKKLRREIKDHDDIKQIKNDIAWAVASLEAMKCICTQYELDKE